MTKTCSVCKRRDPGCAAERFLPFDVIGSAEQEPPWLNQRRAGIGASEMSIVMGVSKWSSNLALYYDKLGEPLPREDPEPEFLLWGKLLEDAIRTEVAKRAGVRIAAVQPLLQSTSLSWALATPDGLTDANEPIEAKNIAWGYDEDEWAVQIPEQYRIQCNHQMLVTGAERCLFGALLWGSRLVWEWVPRDNRLIDRIIVAGGEFWRRVETRNPPPSDGHPDARHVLSRLAIDPEAVELFESEEVAETGHVLDEFLCAWQAAEADYERAKLLEKRAKKQRDATADEVAKALGSHRQGFTGTGWSLTWKTVNRKGYTVEPTSYEQFQIKPPK